MITEYVKLIPKILKNKTNIVEGIINSVKLEFNSLSKEEQDEIIKRRLICKSCIFMSENAKNSLTLSYKTDRLDEHCSLCKCNIKLKTASLDSNCGIEAHNEENNENLELKWKAFKK